MSQPSTQVIAIGNAIVDVMAPCDDALIERFGMTRGGMTLIDTERAKELYAAMGPAREISGGSALANEAGWLLAEGGVTREGVDTAMKLGLNFPRGPFEMLQQHGPAVLHRCLADLEALAPPFLPPSPSSVPPSQRRTSRLGATPRRC